MPVSEVIKMLEAERDKLDAAIKALKSGGEVSSSTKPKATRKAGKKRKVSAAARAKMAQAARERWAKKKAGAKKVVK